MSFSKKELRLINKRSLEAISQNDYQSKSLLTSRNLLNLFKQIELSGEISIFDPLNILGVYAPLKDEPLWFLAFDSFKGTTAFPKYGAGDSLAFIKARLDELESSNEFGVKILSPCSLKEREVVIPHCLLIPGLGFSQEGDRLGRGKGFYDKFLENYKGIRIGVGFDEILSPLVPRDDHDEVLDYIVTDLEILKMKNEK